MLLVIGALAISTGLALSAFSYRALVLANIATLFCMVFSMYSHGSSVLLIIVTSVAGLMLQQAAYLAGVAWRVRGKAKAELGAMRPKSG